MSFEEFQKYNFDKSISEYWNKRSKDRSNQQNTRIGIPKLYIPGQAFDKVFGGNSVDIRPQGSAELIFGLKINRLDNPSLTEEQRRTTTFDFQEKIQMNVIGKIGDKLKLTTNFNTEATFDFENTWAVFSSEGHFRVARPVVASEKSTYGPFGPISSGRKSIYGVGT